MLKNLRKLIFTSKHGFTLIEMMIVLLIISILLLIAVPNMTKSNAVVTDKSTEATVKLVQSQVAAYQMDHDGSLPATLNDLLTGNYVNSITTSNGTELDYDAATGTVSAP